MQTLIIYVFSHNLCYEQYYNIYTFLLRQRGAASVLSVTPTRPHHVYIHPTPTSQPRDTVSHTFDFGSVIPGEQQLAAMTAQPKLTNPR